MPPPKRAIGTATASSPQRSHTTPALNADTARVPTTPTRAAPLPHPQTHTPTPLNAGRRLQRHPPLPIAVTIDASIPDRPNYATDEWARTHLSYFDTHGLTNDDIEVGMQTIFNHLGAHPMSIPINGLADMGPRCGSRFCRSRRSPGDWRTCVSTHHTIAQRRRRDSCGRRELAHSSRVVGSREGDSRAALAPRINSFRNAHDVNGKPTQRTGVGNVHSGAAPYAPSADVW